MTVDSILMLYFFTGVISGAFFYYFISKMLPKKSRNTSKFPFSNPNSYYSNTAITTDIASIPKAQVRKNSSLIGKDYFLNY